MNKQNEQSYSTVKLNSHTKENYAYLENCGTDKKPVLYELLTLVRSRNLFDISRTSIQILCIALFAEIEELLLSERKERANSLFVIFVVTPSPNGIF